jgi:anti-sigma B factor antagonist
MEFNIEKFENYTKIQVLEEKLDTHIAPALKSELVLISGKGEKMWLWILSNCKYCDSSGLSAILVANRLSKNANGIFVLTGLNDAVERLITISQLDTVLNITPTVQDAAKLIETEQKAVMRILRNHCDIFIYNIRK